MRTILVVDDSPTMRRMIMASLRDLGDVGFDQAGERASRPSSGSRSRRSTSWCST
jgi:CheY-like chemotaxis protein